MVRTNRIPGVLLAAVVLGAGSMNASAQSDDSYDGALGATSPDVPMDTSAFEARRALRLRSSDTTNALHITLPPTDHTPESAPAGGNGPLQVAFDRRLPEEYEGNLSSQMDWVPLEDETFASQASVTSPGATDMRMGVRVDLPPEAEIRFFGTDSTQNYPVVTREDISWKGFEPQTLWSPIVEGETIGIEIILPSKESLSTFTFEIDGVSHGYLGNGGFGPVPQLCSNQVDAICRTNRFNSALIGTVAQISYRSDSGGGFVCSGTMMNDKDERHFIPYFLTANHCISSQNEARSIVARWYYLPATCGSTARHSRYFRTDFGANMLATSPRQDSSFLVFRNRAGRSQSYSGWTSELVPIRRDVFGLHHPSGVTMKYSAGRTTRFKDVPVCEDPDAGIGCNLVSNAIEVDWSDGLTEGGSSGSGLIHKFARGERLVGVLSGGREGCTDTISSYGNFRDFYGQVSRYLNATTAPIAAPPYVGSPVNDDHGNTPATATTVGIPSTTRGVINRAGDPDWFRIGVPRAGRLTVQTTGSTDTTGRLLRGTTEIRRNNDDGVGLNFRIVENVQAGTHYVEVRGSNNVTTGPYSLQVSLSGSTPPPTAGTLPFFTPASNRTQRSYARITNKSNQAGTVTIHAIDDTGRRRGPALLQFAAKQTRHFDSVQLEGGRGMVGGRGVGDGERNWRLELSTTLDITPLAYIRGDRGFVTTMHDVVRTVANRQHVVAFNKAPVNPETAWSYGLVRLINPNDSQVDITISGQDDRGDPGDGTVRLSLPARAARMVTSTELEQGGDGLVGRLGNEGTGRWQLFVSATRPVWVMSLMFSPTAGYITNLSSERVEP